MSKRSNGEFEIPDGPPPRAFRDFFVQGGIALILLVVLVQGVFRLGQFLGPLIPFAWEKQVSAMALKDFPLSDRGPEARARREVLQRLTDELVPFQKFPPGMTVTIHYANLDQVNAFATLGGNIVVYEGLIERLPSENALSMVIGHEMSHVKSRDALRSISAEQLATLVVGLATGDSGLAAQIVSNIELLTSLQFSREVEERADRDGLTSLNGHYGHVNGYLQTFDALEDWVRDHGGEDTQPPEFLRDHPDTATRKLKLAALAERNHWKMDGPLTSLRQANFLPKQKFGPWGPPADNGPKSKGSVRDGTTNYEPGTAPVSQTPPVALAPAATDSGADAPVSDPSVTDRSKILDDQPAPPSAPGETAPALPRPAPRH
jgi:Zn-dependent protease with chaperone function